MKALVFHDIGDIRMEEVADPRIEQPTDAVVRLTASAICGTDLHMIRGTMPGMKKGTVLGHEGVGIVEALGDDVRNLSVGDRVVIPSTIACGSCSYCRAGYYAQCDTANPNGPQAGTAFFGGPASTGPFDGMQAEKVRVPYAHVGLVRVPEDVSDEQAILISDIWPTGWFGAELAEIDPGDVVAVFGCGPVGLFAILSAQLQGAGRVLAVDRVASRFERARDLGAEVVDFEAEDPVETLRRLTGGIGPDRVIDAVGVDAEPAEHGPAKAGRNERKEHREQVEQVAPDADPEGDLWRPGQAPTQAIEWAVEAVAKAGTVAIIGVYPEHVETFPLGKAMNKNLTIKMGNCNHRRYIPHLLELVASGAVDPATVLSHQEPLADTVEAFEAFDRREEGWIKVELVPAETAIE